MVSKFYSTGCLIEDLCFGGGLPVGQIVEVLGEPDSGKTSLMLCAAAHLQESENAIIRYIDAEGHTEDQHIANMGMDMSEKCFTPLDMPSFEELKLKLVEWVEKTKRPQLIILDTLGMVPFKDYLNKPLPPALRARKWREFLSGGFMKTLRHSKTVFVINNHLSAAISRDYTKHVASIESPGGKAIKFLASRRMIVTKWEDSTAIIRGRKTLVGFQVRLKNIKGKILKPLETLRSCRLFVHLEKGLQPWYSCLLYLSKEQKRTDGKVTLLEDTKMPMAWIRDMAGNEEIKDEIHRQVLHFWIGSEVNDEADSTDPE